MRLMIVDDNKVIRSIMRALLVHPGDEVRELDNGEDAVDQAAAFRPDVVLMDIQMEGMSGVAATRLIKQQTPGTHIIVVSNFADAQSRNAALQAGADEVLSKENLIELPRLLRNFRR